MKSIRNAVRIWHGASRPAGDEITFEVPIKFLGKGALSRKTPKRGTLPGRERGQPGDSAL